MTEFEVHQLIIATRAEFDLATALYVVLGLAFMAIAVAERRAAIGANRWLILVTYLTASAFVAIRAYAAILRFGKLNALLKSMDSSFVVENPAVGLPTLALRIVLAILITVLTVHYLRRSAAP